EYFLQPVLLKVPVGTKAAQGVGNDGGQLFVHAQPGKPVQGTSVVAIGRNDTIDDAVSLLPEIVDGNGFESVLFEQKEGGHGCDAQSQEKPFVRFATRRKKQVVHKLYRNVHLKIVCRC